MRLTEYNADSPQAWLRNINSTFATMAMPALLMDTVGDICDDPTAVADPYGELQIILLGLSATQKTTRLLDHPILGPNKPSVLMDQLIAVKPDSLDDVIHLAFRNTPTT
jgi:hypothetical protein